MIHRGLKTTIMLLAAISLGCWSSNCWAALIAPVTLVLHPCSTGQSLLQPQQAVMADGAWDLKDDSDSRDPDSRDPAPVKPRNERFAWFVPGGANGGDMGGTSGSVVNQTVAATAWLPSVFLWKTDNQFATLILKSSKLPVWQFSGRLFRPPR